MRRVRAVGLNRSSHRICPLAFAACPHSRLWRSCRLRTRTLQSSFGTLPRCSNSGTNSFEHRWAKYTYVTIYTILYCKIMGLLMDTRLSYGTVQYMRSALTVCKLSQWILFWLNPPPWTQVSNLGGKKSCRQSTVYKLKR